MRTLVAALAVVALPVAAAGPAAAAHFEEEGSGCYACHTLDARQSDPATSAINLVSRTLPLMKAFAGNRTPERFGCTFCHSNPGNAAMREALSHFGARPSRHPVGFSFRTRADSGGEYLSTVGSATADELDCVDCHDAALLAPDAAEGSYVDHAPPGDPRRAGNPLMLLGVTAAGRYDDHCRRCHGAAAPPVKGLDARVVSHADAAAAPILERDGTPLRTTDAGGDAQCTACHDTHFSDKVRLFNDGHEGDEAIVSSDCTSVCHYAGDAGDAYATQGHGAGESTYPYAAGRVSFEPPGAPVAMGMTCTACHVSIDTSDTSPGRRSHAPRPTEGSPADRYRAAFGLNLPVQAWDTGSPFGAPLVGICFSCHAASDHHKTDAGPAAGCLDCHDEHAEGVGANRFMVRRTIPVAGSFAPPSREAGPGERVRYETTRLDPDDGEAFSALDFFRAGDADGACDNAACHPGFAPLAAFMEEGGHPEDAQDPGADCGACHRHSGDPAGGWRATSPPGE